MFGSNINKIKKPTLKLSVSPTDLLRITNVVNWAKSRKKENQVSIKKY
jgi:hypothetical protein